LHPISKLRQFHWLGSSWFSSQQPHCRCKHHCVRVCVFLSLSVFRSFCPALPAHTDRRYTHKRCTTPIYETSVLPSLLQLQKKHLNPNPTPVERGNPEKSHTYNNVCLLWFLHIGFMIWDSNKKLTKPWKQ
jgi:hypothetical protein